MLYFPISCYFPWPCFFRSASRSPASTFFVDLGGGGGAALCLNFGARGQRSGRFPASFSWDFFFCFLF